MKLTNELKVGIIVFLALLSLFIALFFIKNLSIFEPEGKNYTATFNYLGNLKNGSFVKISGAIKVGNITSMEFKDGLAHVHFIINNPEVILTENTIITIGTAGMLGEPFLQIDYPKTNLGTVIQEDSVIKGTDPVDIGTAINELKTGIDEFKVTLNVVNVILKDELLEIIKQVRIYVKSEEVKKIIDNLSVASGNLNNLLNNSNSLVVDLKDKHVTNTFGNLNTTLTNLNEQIISVTTELESFISNTDRGVQKALSNDQGVLGVTAEAKNTIKNMNNLIDSLKEISNSLNDQGTPAGTLIKDPNTAKNLKELIKNLTEISDKIKNSSLLKENNYTPGPF